MLWVRYGHSYDHYYCYSCIITFYGLSLPLTWTSSPPLPRELLFISDRCSAMACYSTSSKKAIEGSQFFHTHSYTLFHALRNINKMWKTIIMRNSSSILGVTAQVTSSPNMQQGHVYLVSTEQYSVSITCEMTAGKCI